MMRAGAGGHNYALANNLRAVYAAHIAAMVVGHFSDFWALVAFMGAISNPPIALPIADTVLAADIDAKIVRFMNHVFGSNLWPDRVVEQAVVVEISLERRHARESFFLEPLPKRTTLFICHRLFVVGHKQNPPI
jgi:hypothetical protein